LGVDVSFSQRGLTIVGILNQQRQRLNILLINAPPPSATLPMVPSSNSTPLPPRTRLKSSATGGPQPSKQSCQNRTSSNNPPPDLPSLAGLSTASGSQPRKSYTSSSKSRARAPQPPSSSTSSNANATLPSTPRHLGKLKSSQRSSSLPPSSNSTRPSHSQDDNVPLTPNQHRTREQEAHADMERAAAAALGQICEGRAKKKSEEERIQQKLRNLGVCGRNYPWIKQSSGYRCAGGSHFISDPELL
jgi:hypothetical protein